MTTIVRRFLFLVAASGVALLAMGAGPLTADTAHPAAGGPTGSLPGGERNGAFSTPSNTLSGGPTGSVVSMPSSSPASGPTGSVSRRPVSGPGAGPGAGRKTRAVALSPYSEELARTIKFDRRVLVLVKEETGERIQRLVGYDADGYQIVAPGIAVSVPEDGSERILAALRKKLASLRYMAFVVEMNDALKIDKIGVLKGTDHYDILRVMHTDGPRYDVSNQDVISRLKSWEKLCSFTIIGAGSDWVDIEFRTLPKKLKDFAEEVYDFSPDAVDQGPGTVEGLMKDMKKTKRLFLWWSD